MIRYLTASEIASVHRRPIGTVYRLAKTDEWARSTDCTYPVLYCAAAVEATFNRLAKRKKRLAERRNLTSSG